MTDPLLEEVYRAREKLWQRGGGTMRGVGEYLRECGRRAKERGVLWIESEEEREAIGAEVRARLAAEGPDVSCVKEAQAVYGGAAEEVEGPKAEARRGALPSPGGFRSLEVDPVLSRVKEPEDWFGDESGEWEAVR